MPPIRVVSIMEAAFVTGPAKNLIRFASRAREEIDLSIITYERGGDPPENPFVDTARAEGIRVDLVRERGRFDPAVAPQLRRILEALQPQIVQTHNVKSHFLMRWSGLNRRYTWLAFHHGYTTTDLKMLLYNQLDRWSLRAPRHLVTVCGAFSRQLQDIGVPASRITIRHNFIQPAPAVEPGVAARTRSVIPAPEGTPILLSVGRLSKEKGHVDLVEAMAELRGQPFHLVIVGEGPERGTIERAIARHRLEERISLAGLRHDIQAYYAIADMVVISSHSEGSPNVLLEAMAAGLPVVATDVGGIPEIVTDEDTALLAPAGDRKALAARIKRILDEPAVGRRLGEAARRKAEAEYSPEAYCRSLTTLYRSLLETKSPPQ